VFIMPVVNTARREGVDADVFARVIRRQVARESQHARFGDGIVDRLERTAAVRALVNALVRSVQTVG